MKTLVRQLYSRITAAYAIRRFRRAIVHNGGFAGKPFAMLNARNISVGRNVRLKDGYRIECYETFYNQRLRPKMAIEDGVIIGPRFTAFVADTLVIGKDTILAGNVTLITENHGINPELPLPYHAQKLTTAPVTIGEGCWLGQNVSVLPGVKIGRRCVIATNAVVTRDIPDFCIAAGSPAKVIKKYNFQKHCWENTD